jgi:hypothetical protein
LEKLRINTSGQYRITDFKEDIESSVGRMGETYEELLFRRVNIDKLRD